MEADTLQDRLCSNAEAFDGLLSLIPSKLYYGEDTSNQWQKKKQSKAEAKAARRGKLDPNSALNRNAKEVMDERAKKRKLEEMSDDDSRASADESSGGVEHEQPGQGLRRHEDEAPSKKQKVSKAKQAKNSEKRVKSQEKRAAKKKAKEEKEKEKHDGTSKTVPSRPTPEKPEEQSGAEERLEESNPEPVLESAPGKKGKATKKEKPKKESKEKVKTVKTHGMENTENKEQETESKLEEPSSQDQVGEPQTKPTPQSSPDSDPVSPTFDESPRPETAEAEEASVATSINGGNDGEGTKRKHIQVPDEEKMAIFREKLHAKLAGFREARGAGPNGKPVRSRADLIEARRLEQARKKAHKKELRQKVKEEEDRKREEALKAASVRSSPLGSLSPSVHEANTNFSFGRVSFSDGVQISRDLTYVLKNDKKKGPSDPKTALAKLENQKAKIAALGDDKRKEVLEKETWLAARKRAEGEKVRDDEMLLKKAVKRKEKTKKKSEKEWKERARGVEMAIKAKQAKREGNIRKRREEKALGKMGKGKGKKSKANKKVKARPGFEGSFSLGGAKK